MGKASQEELQTLVNQVAPPAPPLTVKNTTTPLISGHAPSDHAKIVVGGALNPKYYNQQSDSQLMTMRDEPIGHDLVLETVSSIRNLHQSPSHHLTTTR